MSKLNWSIWLRMPSLTANQAVALSLGTDPNNLAWNFQAANRDRLTLFKACHKTPIAPADLAKWAQSVEWNIPLELAALAPIVPVELVPLPTDAVIQALSEIVVPGVSPEVLLSEASKAGVKFFSDNGESIAVIPDGTVMGHRVGFKYLRGSLPNSVGHLIRGSSASGGGAVQSATTKPIQQAPANTPAPEVPTGDGVAKPLQRTAAQDAAIICEIKKQGYDPLRVPANPSGGSGVKRAVRDAIDGRGLFAGTTVFNKAWERMSSRGDIVIQG